MNFMKLCIAAAIVAGSSGPVLAQPAAEGTTAEQAKIVIPFSPPLGQEIGFRMSKSQPRDGKPREISMDLFVSFDRKSNGFEMRTRLAQTGNLTGSPVDKLLSRPIVFRLSLDGTITGVVDEEAYWKLMDEAIDRFMPADMKKDPQGRALFRRLILDMRNLPDDQRLALLSKNYQPLLEMTGAELAVGEMVEGADETSLPFPSLGNVPLQRQIRLTLESADQDTATFKYVTAIDPEDMKAAIEKLMHLAPPEKREPVPPMKFRQEAVYVVSVKTGLTQSYEEVIEADGEGDTGKRVTKLVRISN